MNKDKYRIDFNWYGELHTYFRWGSSVNEVKALAFIQLSKDLRRSRLSVHNYLMDSRSDRVKVTKLS